MYNFAEIFLKSLFIMRQFTILHLNFVCSHCNPKLYLVKTWDFSNNCYAFDHYNAKAKMLLLLSHWNWQGMCVERSRVPTLQICKRMWPQEKSHHQMGLLRFSYTYVLNRSSFVEKLINWVRFLSNAIIIQDSGGFKDSDLEFL